LALPEKWGNKYGMAVRSWENNWNELATFFDYTPEIRRLIYTTNPIEAYNRQLRKVTKAKTLFPTPEAVVACPSGHRQEMDDASAQLGPDSQSIGDPFSGAFSSLAGLAFCLHKTVENSQRLRVLH
jgi:transposase-like protein